MAKAKVIVDYSTNRYSDIELSNKADTVVTGLTDNPAFPTLASKATEIKAVNDNFRSLLARMAEGSKQVTLEKKDARISLENLLGSTAVKVQDLSGGEELLINTTGFDVKRKPIPVGELECPEKVKATPGSSRGTLEVTWEVVPNAYIYELKYTEAPSSDDSKWIQTSNTKRKIVIDGLTRGKAYAIQVAAAGSDPRRVWSDEIISFVM